MKIMTVLGTRPEIIRLCRTIEKLDRLCDYILVNTGQNYDPNLNDVFFKQLGIRNPDYHFKVMGNPGEQIGKILIESEKVMKKERPDKFLVLGDTNSSLAAIMAKRMGIPVYHMEAGNRCYDDRVPEEVNRRLIDHCSDILLPYTKRSRNNLLKEGIPNHRIHVTGNPIKEVLDYYESEIKKSKILNMLSLKRKEYFLVTMHRAENVDIDERLKKFVQAFNLLHVQYKVPIVISMHPHTGHNIDKLSIKMGKGVISVEPPGLFDFVHLEKNALCVLSDSGTVQEECCIFKIPNVTIRDVTERPETLEVGSNILSGAEPDSILRCVRTVLSKPPVWEPPPEYIVKDVSNTVINILMGHIEKKI